MNVAIGADHGGFELKEFLKNNFGYFGISWVDVGTYNSESCDYPIIADKLSEVILIFGSGIGISIAANRHKGIRAALLYNNEVASLAKEHNNANVAVFGARTQTRDEVVKYLTTFLNTPFSNGERHCRRIEELG